MDTLRPSPRTNRTRRVPHPVLIGHGSGPPQDLGLQDESHARESATAGEATAPSGEKVEDFKKEDGGQPEALGDTSLEELDDPPPVADADSDDGGSDAAGGGGGALDDTW